MHLALGVLRDTFKQIFFPSDRHELVTLFAFVHDAASPVAFDVTNARVGSAVHTRLQLSDFGGRKTKSIRLHAATTALEVGHSVETFVRSNHRVVGRTGGGWGECMRNGWEATVQAALGKTKVAFVLGTRNLGRRALAVAGSSAGVDLGTSGDQKGELSFSESLSDTSQGLCANRV